MKKDEYIELVLKHISNKAEQFDIRTELLGHIEDEEMRYIDAGYSQEYAQEKALSLMGDPDKIGEELDRLHSNKKYKILGILFSLLYLIYPILESAVVFGMENTYDATMTLSIFSSVSIAVKHILSTASMFFATKSKNAPTLCCTGILNIIGIFFSPYALIILSESDAIKVFMQDMSLLSFIQLLLPIINGLVCFITAIKISRSYNKIRDEKFFKGLSVYRIIIIIITIIFTINSIANCFYHKNDNDNYEQELRAEYNDSLQYVDQAKKEFDDLVIPQTPEQAIDFAKKKNLGDDVIQDFEFTVDACIYNDRYFSVLLKDDDYDEIYETKQISVNTEYRFTDEEIEEIKNIQTGITIDAFFEHIELAKINEYAQMAEGKDTIETIIISLESNSHPEFHFKNGIMTDILLE